MMESSGILGISITKFGWIKLFTLGAAGVGALMMAVFRPPRTKKEMFYQGVVALGCSFLFGPVAVSAVAYYLPFYVDPFATHGLIGALSWGVFGGLAFLRDKLGSKSLDESVKDIVGKV